MNTNSIFSENDIKNGASFLGTGLFYNVLLSGAGNLILGSPFFFPSVVGSLMLSLPFVAFEFYLESLKKKYPKVSFVQEQILPAIYVISSAALGAVIMGHLAVGAVLASSIGLGLIFAAFLAFKLVVDLMPKSKGVAPLDSKKRSPFENLPLVHASYSPTVPQRH